jgi:hypothetical protein
MLSVKFHPRAGTLCANIGNAPYKSNLIGHDGLFALVADPRSQDRLCCFALRLVVLHSSHFLSFQSDDLICARRAVVERRANPGLKSNNSSRGNCNLMAALADVVINLLVQARDGFVLGNPVVSLWA